MAIQTITLDPNAENLEDQSINVRNQSGGAFAEGDLVYVDGWDETSGRWTVELAQALAVGSRLAQFVLRVGIADASNGQAFRSFRLTGLDTSSSSVGDALYLSDSVAGGFVTIAPSFDRQIIGRVAVVNVVTGEVQLFVQPDTDSGFVRTSPVAGEFPIRSIQRDSVGNIGVDFDDVVVP